MIRATTPLQEFVFPDNPSTYSRILITYSQNDAIVLEKEKDNLTFTEEEDGSWVGVFRMTQDEANMFEAGMVVWVQVRVLTSNNEALASEKSKFKVEDVLNDEVL